MQFKPIVLSLSLEFIALWKLCYILDSAPFIDQIHLFFAIYFISYFTNFSGLLSKSVLPRHLTMP